jgi:hypothetical protein
MTYHQCTYIIFEPNIEDHCRLLFFPKFIAFLYGVSASDEIIVDSKCLARHNLRNWFPYIPLLTIVVTGVRKPYTNTEVVQVLSI